MQKTDQDLLFGGDMTYGDYVLRLQKLGAPLLPFSQMGSLGALNELPFLYAGVACAIEHYNQMFTYILQTSRIAAQTQAVQRPEYAFVSLSARFTLNAEIGAFHRRMNALLSMMQMCAYVPVPKMIPPTVQTPFSSHPGTS